MMWNLAAFQSAPPSSAKAVPTARSTGLSSFPTPFATTTPRHHRLQLDAVKSPSTIRNRRSSSASHNDSPSSSSSSSSRRSFFSSLATFAAAATVANAPYNAFEESPLSLSSAANAAETIGKDPNCDSPACLGVWDGLLADCPHDGVKFKGGGAGCVSSQDDTPGIFAEPWDYSDNLPLSSSSETDEYYKSQMDQLILALQTTSRKNGDEVQISYQEGRYLRALFKDGKSNEVSIGEFYFTPNDTTVQFRIGSAKSSSPSSAAGSLFSKSTSNAERSERLRKSMNYLKVPVLRNRKRTFLFVESDDLDGFGPGSAALGPPEEMSPGEYALEGAMELGFKAARGLGGGGSEGGRRTARGSDEVDPKLRIDWVESFPLK